jgi:hypothetical protein
MNTYHAFAAADLPAFEPTEKIGLLATVNADGKPHLTLITAMQAKTPTQLIWGQFTEGLSKQHVRHNPNVGFLIMTLDRRLWRGTARYTHAVKEGPDYEMFNRKPMFRYNSYFGINTVHYMDLRETYGCESLPLAQIVPAALLTTFGKGGAQTPETERILTPWAEGLFNRVDSLKFLAYVAVDSYPRIVPLLQCRAADSRRLVFSPLAYRDELTALPAGAETAIFGLTLQMEDVLVRGVFRGFASHRLVKLGAVDLNWVYNSMPPAHGQIYPREPFRPVVDF